MDQTEIIKYIQIHGEFKANDAQNNDAVNTILREGSQKTHCGGSSKCKQTDARKEEDIIGVIKNDELYLTFRFNTPFMTRDKNKVA